MGSLSSCVVTHDSTAPQYLHHKATGEQLTKRLWLAPTLTRHDVTDEPTGRAATGGDALGRSGS